MALTAEKLNSQVAQFLDVAIGYCEWDGETLDASQLSDPINFQKFSLSVPKQETEKLESNMEGTKGQVLASVQKPTTDTAKLSAEFNRGSRSLLALAVGADLEETSQTGATFTDQAVTLAVGVWCKLGHEKLSSFDGLKTSGDVTVAASHYEVNLLLGRIKPLDATGATGAKASYKTATRSGIKLTGGQAKSSYLYFEGTATNKTTGKRGILKVHRVNVAPDGEWDPVAGGFLKGAISGECETPQYSGYSVDSPWEFDEEV